MSPKQVRFINRQKGFEKTVEPGSVKTSNIQESAPFHTVETRRVREVVRAQSPPPLQSRTVKTTTTTQEVSNGASYPPPPPSSVSSQRTSATTIRREDLFSQVPYPPTSAAASTVYSHVRVSPPQSQVRTGPGSTSQDAINSSLKNLPASRISVVVSTPPTPPASPHTKGYNYTTTAASRAQSSVPFAPSPPSSSSSETKISLGRRRSSAAGAYKAPSESAASTAPTALTIRVKERSTPSAVNAPPTLTIRVKDPSNSQTTSFYTPSAPPSVSISVRSSHPTPSPIQLDNYLLTKTTTYAHGTTCITSTEDVATTTTIQLPRRPRQDGPGTALIINEDDSDPNNPNMSVLGRIAAAKVINLPGGSSVGALEKSQDLDLDSKTKHVEIKSLSRTLSSKRREERRVIDEERERVREREWHWPCGTAGFDREVVHERWAERPREQRRASASDGSVVSSSSVAGGGGGGSRRGSREERNKEGKVVLIVGMRDPLRRDWS